MERELFFHILGIEETKEEGEIRKAYREKLKGTNPEDNPEGFKRLRLAYEGAMKFAGEAQKGNGRAAAGEVGLWIGKVDRLYHDLMECQKAEAWEKLLADPVCEGLDTSLEARDCLLEFLMGHWYLPHRIWLLIDGVFRIRAELESLSVRFPLDFLKLLRYYMEKEDFLPYAFFRYRLEEKEGADRDAYIAAYLEVKQQMDMGRTDGLLQKLEDLAAYHVYHPYEDVERMRIWAKFGRIEESRGLLRKLCREYPGEAYIGIHAGNLLWSQGEKEQAYQCWKAVLEKEPESYGAKYGVVRRLVESGEYGPAREMILQLLEEEPYNEELGRWLHQANEALIREIRAKMAAEGMGRAQDGLVGMAVGSLESGLLLEESGQEPREARLLSEESGQERKEGGLLSEESGRLPESSGQAPGEADWPEGRKKQMFRLAWCLFQNGYQEELEALLEGMPEAWKMTGEYCNLSGKYLHYRGRYEEAIPYLQKWLEELLASRGGPEESGRKYLSSTGKAYFNLGSCYAQLGRIEEAGRYIRKAAASESGNGKKEYLQYYASILVKKAAYQEAIEVCNGILRDDDGCFPAYLIRQEACYELGRAQEVVDDYHRAVGIYAGFYQPYLLAAEVFLDYGQYEDAMEVLKQAGLSQVKFTAKMKLCEIRLLRGMAKNGSDREAIRKRLDALQAEWKVEASDLEDQSELEFEQGLLWWDDGKLREALVCIERAMHQNPGRLQYRMACRELRWEMHKFEKAPHKYKAVEADYEGCAGYYYRRGMHYRERGNIKAKIQD